MAGGLNLYGYAGGDPVNWSDPFGLSPDTLTTYEREHLGDFCNQIDCSKVQVHRGNDDKAMNQLRRDILGISSGRSFTFGHHIFLGDGNVGDFAVLAHEVQHIVQYDKWGAAEYLRRGAQERIAEMRGQNPYSYSFNGRRLEQYGMEQQGQIVEDCLRGNTAACWVARIP